jgi:hypothetical protein
MFENYMNWLGPKIGPITLSNWNPNPTKFYIIENTNEKLKIEPQAGLAVRASDFALCEDANGYLTWFYYTGFEANPRQQSTKIFYKNHLENCYNKILNSETIHDCDDKESIFVYLSPVYSGWNIGHELSVIVYTSIAYNECVKKFPEKNVKLLVSKQAIGNSENTKIILDSLFPKNKIVFLETDIVYQFDNLVVPPANYFHLQNSNYPGHPGQVDQVNDIFNILIENSKVYREKYSKIISDCQGKFILSKLEVHSAFRKEGILPSNISDKLQKNNWYVIDPEKINFLEVVYLLSQSKKVLLGSGAIQYAHKYFISSDSDIFLLFDGNHNYPQYRHQKIEKRLMIPQTGVSNDFWIMKLGEFF